MASVSESKVRNNDSEGDARASPKKALSLQQRLQMQMQQRRKKQLLLFKQRARNNEKLPGTPSARPNYADVPSGSTRARHTHLLNGTANTPMANNKGRNNAKNSGLSVSLSSAGNDKAIETKTVVAEEKVNPNETKKQGRPMLIKFRQKAQEIRTVMRVLNSFRHVSETC